MQTGAHVTPDYGALWYALKQDMRAVADDCAQEANYAGHADSDRDEAQAEHDVTLSWLRYMEFAEQEL